MTREKSISVAMATYNGALFLRQQLDSIAAQTMLPAELVVSDDGSTDTTLSIIREFAETAPFEIRIVTPDKRRGFADNFLHAAMNCRHDLIAFCDQDDAWLPEKLEVAFRRINDDRSLLAMHTLITTDQALSPSGLWTQGIKDDAVHEPLELTPYKNGWGNSMMFHRTLLEVIDPSQRPRQPEKPGLPLTHDTWIYVLADGLGRVSHINRPLILYRQHGSNTMGFERSSLRKRLTLRWIASVANERERHVFYRKMSDIFQEISRTSALYGTQALAAANHYSSMSAPLQDRLDAYDAPSFSRRFDAYRKLHLTRKLSPLSRLKHLGLGVSGLHRFTESLSK
ncbi:MAG: glycosyltransferase family 2 protein [Proteobacteria bacterium]|nr:glycosyltransferase family 2 protein [Pseudomonadota bacterium]